MKSNTDSKKVKTIEDERRLVELYHMYYPLAFSVAKKYLSYDDSLDAVQDSFHVLYLKYDLGIPDNEVKSLLCKIVKSKCVDRIRRFKSETKRYEAWYFNNMQKDYEKSDALEKTLIIQEVCSQVLEEIKSMRVEWGDILFLHTVLQYSQDEVADMMGIHITVLRSRLNRARKFLREKYGEEVRMLL